MPESYELLRDYLTPYGQEHLIDHWVHLNDPQRESLAREIRQLDFDLLRSLREATDQQVDWEKRSQRAEPPKSVRISDSQSSADRRKTKSLGEEAIGCGRIGVILVAGGQGTRLGFDQPKGMFRIGPLSNRSLFEMHVDRLLAVMNRYDVSIPLYIMTSPLTDQETRAYFADHDRLGLEKDQLIIFCQGTMPAVDEKTGKVLLSSPHEIALSPDGHGGMLQALHREGVLEHAKDRGIEHFFYAQVDNPLVPLCDPELIGHHLAHRSQMTTQVVQKRSAKEKVGNVVQIDGRIAIIEYSDLPDSVAEKRASDGSLFLWAGNIAVHILDRKFLEECQSSASLPFHRASKVVPTLDQNRSPVKPTSPNAIKYERFIFDLLPLAERAIVVEGEASQVFAPVKNADGAATDTPDAARKAIIDLHRSWLQTGGASISSQTLVEINPRWALDAEDVAAKIKENQSRHNDPFMTLEVSADTYFSC